ncbi:MAG TPA: VOC family protein [Candidatus Wallbacteria bacterium]|nr:VOC family protein [Candidatus Wallbacteria bacterium]
MKIDHIAVWVSDLEKMRMFYEKYFDGISNSKYTNIKKQFESYFLTFEGGVRIELMRNRHAPKKEENSSLTGLAHFAFSAGSREEVLSLTELLRCAGYTIQTEPRTTGDGYFESSVLDPEGNLIEITI